MQGFSQKKNTFFYLKRYRTVEGGIIGTLLFPKPIKKKKTFAYTFRDVETEYTIYLSNFKRRGLFQSNR